MIQASPEFIEAMKQPIKEVYIKLEFYTKDMKFIEEFTKKVSKNDIGSISVDRNRPIRRSFSLTLDNKDNEFIWGEDSLVWIDKRIKLYIGLMVADGTIHYVPQGVFLLTEPSDMHRINDGKKAIINCVDKAYLFTDRRGKIVNELTIEEGASVTTAIRLMFEAGGETLFNFDSDIDAVVPYELTFSGTDNVWKVGEELAIFAQCDLFYDVNGYLRLKKIDLNDLWLYPPTWTYTYGDISDRFYAGNMRRFDDTILSNHIRVLGGSSQYAEVLFDLKVDENESIWENNPYRIEQIGEWTYFHNDNRPDPLITTHSEAFWRAKYELMNRLGYTEKISLQIAPNYLHDASDVIAIIDEENNVSGRYLIESFNLPIIPDLLTIETRKERRIIDDWDFVVTEYGDIVGKVTNVSEEELEGVKLVLTSVTTGYSDTVHSNFFGNYRFIKVPEANDYVITASLEDYQEKIKDNIKVEGGIITEVDLEMVV